MTTVGPRFLLFAFFGALFMMAVSVPSDSSAHGDNPDHISVFIGPAKSGTVTSTPFSSLQTDSCGSTHSIDYCHHHVSGLVAFDWSADIGASHGQNVFLNATGGAGGVETTGYVYAITPNCSASNPRGYNVFVEVWARLTSNGIWRKIGYVNHAHVTPSVSQGQWIGPQEWIGTVRNQTWMEDCWEGVHVHVDYYNNAHYAAWTNAAWFGAGVTFSTSWWLNTGFGTLGGTYGQGPDGHGGTWTGY